MIEVFGDLWEYPADARVITTNGFLKQSGHSVMGRGCAREARDRYPGLAQALGAKIMAHGNHVFRFDVPTGTPGGPFSLLTFPVKHAYTVDGAPGWMGPADPDLIRNSAQEMVAICDAAPWQTIVLPRPGVGNGRLHYHDVRAIIAPLLDDRFHVITFAKEDQK